jgi:hypothetical protein
MIYKFNLFIDVTRRILSCQAAKLLTGPVWFYSDAVRSDDPDRSSAKNNPVA